MGTLEQPVREEVLFHLGGIPVSRIVVVTWGVMLLLIAAALVTRFRLRKENPGRFQQAIEALLEWLGGEIRDIMGRDPWPFIPLVVSLFVFILASNLVSYFSSFFAILKPPTADISTTAALATVVFFAVPFYGVKFSGVLNYLKNFVRPVWIMLPFNIISEVSRTVALAIRLFGNIISGEILIGVILSIVPFFLPLPLMFLSLITGTIQAYIFTVLTIVYIGSGISVAEKDVKEEKNDN